MWLTLWKFWLLVPLWWCKCYFCLRFPMRLPQGHLRWPDRDPLDYSPIAPCTNLLQTILIINPHQNEDYLGDCLITIHLIRQPACYCHAGGRLFCFFPHHNVCAPSTLLGGNRHPTQTHRTLGHEQMQSFKGVRSGEELPKGKEQQKKTKTWFLCLVGGKMYEIKFTEYVTQDSSKKTWSLFPARLI